MRLWIINQYALEPTGSGGSRHHNLAQNMSNYGLDSTIIASPTHYLTRNAERASHSRKAYISESDGVKFVWLHTPSYAGNGLKRVWNMIYFAIQTIRFSRRYKGFSLIKPDIILGSSPQPFGALAAYFLAKLFKVPFVLEIRDIWPKSMISLTGASQYHPFILLLSAIEKFLYKRANLTVGLLQGVGDHAKNLVGHPIPWIWIPNGVNAQNYPKNSLRADDGIFCVMYTGAHGVPNSLETALGAAKIIQEGGEDHIRFQFIGDGVNKQLLIRNALQNQINNVEFLDSVPKPSMPETLSKADTFLLLFRRTDLYKDGLSPNKMFDYLAAGRPIIMAVDSPHDPIAQANAGVSIAPEDPQALADAILHLSKLPAAERQAMGERGRAYVMEHHDMKGLAAKLANALHVLAGK